MTQWENNTSDSQATQELKIFDVYSPKCAGYRANFDILTTVMHSSERGGVQPNNLD